MIHTHSWASMAVSSLECGLLALTQTAMRFLKIGYHDYQGVVLDTAEQASLIADLGQGEALILRNHGALVVGRSVGEAFNWMHRLELACRAQIGAMSCNSRCSRRPGTTTSPARAGLTGSWNGRRCCASWTAWIRATATETERPTDRTTKTRRQADEDFFQRKRSFGHAARALPGGLRRGHRGLRRGRAGLRADAGLSRQAGAGGGRLHGRRHHRHPRAR